MKITSAPGVIRTAGLGSCMGVVIYDADRSIAGMVHVMLPNSEMSKNQYVNPAKFADTGIAALRNKLIKAGAASSRLRAKIAGGSQMFQFHSKSELMRIGPRNIEAVKSRLSELGIMLAAEDTGGDNGRTIEFDPVSCVLNVKTIHMGEKNI
ncbi:chemotaxis protein CheD [Halobacillus sp. A5]|nr:chemotaxis protein CheD [Halobacillus sp. A5]MCP3026098.1 chemotaxis protein CheD [Halobacillus sp. A5]